MFFEKFCLYLYYKLYLNLKVENIEIDGSGFIFDWVDNPLQDFDIIFENIDVNSSIIIDDMFSQSLSIGCVV